MSTVTAPSTQRIRLRTDVVRRSRGLLLGVALLALTACEGRSPTPPESLRYGQIGSVSVQLTTPITLGLGTLQQDIEWTSAGLWTLREAISYAGVLGDANERTLVGNPEVSAGFYAQWVTQVNETPGLNLFIPDLSPDLNPTCGPTETRVRLTITDAARGESTSWTRCGVGSLQTLTPLGAGPDPAAARVISAAVLAKTFTVGDSFLSDYRGTVPFGTIDRGDNTPASLNGPRVITTQVAWETFWAEHKGGTPPAVDFAGEIVLVAAIGQRDEAGTTVEVRRVLPVQGGTFIEIFERVPGDFCSPASLRRVPFHIVVTPRVPTPVRYAETRIERVPCG